MGELIDALKQEIPVDDINRLLMAKTSGSELSDGHRVQALNDFIETHLNRIATKARLTSNPKFTIDDLDEFFFYAIKNHDNTD